MSSPSDPPDERDGPVELTKDSGDTTPAAAPAQDEPFDPYRFGRPDHPVPPEFAPPGYVPDPVPAGAPPLWAGPPPWAAPPGYPGPSGPYAPQGPAGPPPPGPPYEPYVSPYPWDAPYGPQRPYEPYGQQWQQPYGRPPTAPAGSGKAITALVLGIGSIVMFWTSIFDAVLAIAAVVFGVIALNEHRARANATGPGGSGSRRGMAVAGLICAGVGSVLAIIWTIVIVHASNQCGGVDQRNSSDFQHCVQEHVFN